MEIKVCKNCRRLFHYLTGPELCEDCRRLVSHKEIEETEDKLRDRLKLKPLLKEEELTYSQVRDYIVLNPKASITEIAENNGILPKQLLQWIREERLEFSEDSQFAWFECEICGRKIKSGRLCSNCKLKK